MKATLNLRLVAIVGAFCCSTGNAQISYSNSLVGATLIYSNSFSGSGTVNITNTTPDFSTNLFGGSNNAAWIDVGASGETGALNADGSVTTTLGDSWLLPFKAQSNYVYTLTATVTFTGNPGSWVVAGYAQNYGYSTIANAPPNQSGPNSCDWTLRNWGGNTEFFAGPIQLNAVYNATPPVPTGNGTYTFTQILDTTSSNWVVTSYFNGVQLPAANPPYTFTYPPPNPAPAAILIGQHSLGTPSAYKWNSLTLSAAPLVITRQPVSASIAAGTAFTNTVAVAATSPSYQWYRNGLPLPLAGQTNVINGATNASLILNPAEPGDSSTNYYVVITNSLGSITSAPVSLAVYDAPVVSAAYPVAYSNLVTLYGGQNVGGTNYAGSTPTFSVSIIGEAPLYYQWRTNGVAVSGATNASFTFTNCPLTGPTSFACVVTNAEGSVTNTWLTSYVPAPMAPFPQAVLGFNASSFWRLNEGPEAGGGDNGAIAIDYASGNDGIYSNVSLAFSGYTSTDTNESAVVFGSAGSPSDAYGIQGIDFSTPIGASAAFTVQGWVNGPPTQANGAGIIAKGYNGGEQFALDINGNHYRFIVRDASGNSYSAPAATGPDNAWHFLVGVCDEVNGLVSLYVDGVLAASTPIPSRCGVLSYPKPVTIGARGSLPTVSDDLQFKGFLSDLAIFKYALSTSQIVQEYSTVANVAPYFLQAPPAQVAANAGGSLTIPAAAVGTTPAGYYWTDVNAGTNVAGGGTTVLPLNAGLTVANVPVGWNGGQLELTVTNAFGSTNVSVSLAVLTTMGITNNLPAQINLLTGTTYTYSITPVGELPFYYQWYQGVTKLPGQTNATLTVMAGAPGSTTYFVVITNSFSAVTSLVSTLVSLAPPTNNSYAAGILQLNPAGYWPMHELAAAAPGDIETNYGTLGVLGTAYYPDWVTDYGTCTRQVSGAITGDTDTALHFNWNIGVPAAGVITWTNELYIPHTAPAATLNPPFTVECWLLNTNNSIGGSALLQSVWGQLGLEGLNSGYAGNGTGNGKGIQMAYNQSGAINVYGYFSNNGQNTILSSSGATLGVWHHVVLTCSATTNFTLYVDGASVATGAGVGKYAPDSWTPLAIGGTRGGTRSAIISVDEFAVYTNVITDIAQHHTDGITGGAGAYFHDVTNDHAVIYLRMDAPPYTAPPTVNWPELINYGTVANPGLYTPGTMPGVDAAGPIINGTNCVGLIGTNVAPLSGVSSFADAGYASAYNPTGSNANFTITAMFHGNPCDNRVEAIASRGIDSWQLGISTNGTIVFNAGNGNTGAGGTGSDLGDIKTAGVYNDGKWHQVTVVNTTNVVSIYVDGVLDTNGTPAGTTPTSVIPGNANNVMIGADPSFTNNPTGVGRQFAGQVCEVAFFNQALTSSQARGLYNLALNGPSFVINPNPTNIVFSVTGNQLTLSWPSDHTGWTLQSETNIASTNWVDVPASAATNQVVIPINATNASMFYRMRLQH